MRAQQLGDVQHQIGCGDAFAQLPAHVDADDFGRQKINRLPEHAGFRFDAANAPADHAKSIDHGRVRIGADQRIWIKYL